MPWHKLPARYEAQRPQETQFRNLPKQPCLPGAGGNIEMLARTLENVVDSPTTPLEGQLQRAFENIAMAKVATSAEEARDMLFLAPSDNVTMNRRFLLESAKQEAIGMARAGFSPPRRRTFRLPGKSAVATFEMVVEWGVGIHVVL